MIVCVRVCVCVQSLEQMAAAVHVGTCDDWCFTQVGETLILTQEP